MRSEGSLAKGAIALQGLYAQTPTPARVVSRQAAFAPSASRTSIRASAAIRQLRPIDIVRISPRDGRPGRLPPKELKGAAVHHFGAFFDRTAREHDYLWGRLDGAEQLLNLVAPRLDEGWYRRAFQAVLEEEGPQLPAIGSVIEQIRAALWSQDPQASGA
jgi:Protein of unknown function (DUF3376)